MNPIFTGNVTKGKVVLDSPERYAVHLSRLEGARIELVLRKETHQRTTSQNRYLFGVVYAIIAENTGYEVEQVHDAMKVMFASKRLENNLTITERTSKFDTKRMTEYIDSIKRWAAEFLQVYIPDANEVTPDAG